jgi:hypothetical protein
MSPGWTLLLEILGAMASIAVILDYFGIKPTSAGWGSITALSQVWKLVIMMSLVATTLVFSGYGFYRSFRPKTIEKVIEKPVDRIVEREKIVAADCPNANSRQANEAGKPGRNTAVPMSPPQQLPITQDCGGGNCAASVGQSGGVTAGSINLGPPEPKIEWSQESGALSPNGKPTVVVKLSVDRTLDAPAFLATCSHPCKLLTGGIPIGLSQGQGLIIPNNPLKAGMVLRNPPVLGAGMVFSMTLESQDGQPLTISDVSKVPMSQVPLADLP